MKLLNDNKEFWKNIKPLFSNKQTIKQKNIVIIENDIIFSNNEEVAKKLNDFFIHAVEDLNIEKFCPTLNDNSNYITLEETIEKYNYHPSILMIKEYVKVENLFTFVDTTSNVVISEIGKLDTTKAGVENDIPTKILNDTKDIVGKHLSNIFNASKNSNRYPQELKKADIIPIYKKGETSSLKNYRPISLIPIISKVFERDLYDQIITYMNKFLSPYLFGYRKGYSTEQCLIVMVELWKKALDNKGVAGAIITDLSKAFDCLNHDLLIAKMAAYGFDKNALLFIQNYLRERKQRTKVNGSFSLWAELKYGVPQGSILGPLLFNIFINDMFYFVKETKIANYADDNTIYTITNKIEDLLKILEDETSIILKWFRTNEMKSNNEKCHLIISNKETQTLTLGKEVIHSKNSVELLGINIDKNLNFTDHISNLCNKGNLKLHALARISKYLNESKLKLIMKTFIQSQFNYCPLVWMFHNRTLNQKINKLHERALRIIYKNDNLTFQELLDKDGSVTIHQRNLQKLATEMFKIKNHFSPLPIQNIFIEKVHQHNLRYKRQWENYNVRTVRYGTETIRNMGTKTWDIVPSEIKESKTLIEFKQKIKKWKTSECTCRLCKSYIYGLGFLDNV